MEVSLQFFRKKPGGMRGSLLRLLSSLVKDKALVCPSIIIDATPGVGIVCVCDFYMFACGTFHRIHGIGLAHMEASTFDVLSGKYCEVIGREK